MAHDPADEAFLVELARSMHRLGTPAHRLEEALAAVAERLAVPAEVFAQPTAMILAFGPLSAQRVVVLRAEPGSVDLGRLASVDALVQAVLREEVGRVEASARLAAVMARPPEWSRPTVAAAHVLAASAAAVLFDGSAGDLAVAALIGAWVAGAGFAAERSPGVGRVLLPLCGLGAMALARGASGGVPSVHPALAALAGLIVLLPGFTLTVAMVELATGHLVSGVARAAGAMVSLLLLTVGVALGTALVPLPAPADGRWTSLAAEPAVPWLLVAGAAFAVLMRARAADMPVVMGAAVVAWSASTGVAEVYGAATGAGGGAAALGIAAGVWSRAAGRSATVALAPGMMVLVPGSLGYRAVDLLQAGEVVPGVEAAFQTGMVAVSLAAGLVLAHAVVGRRAAL